MEELNEDFWTQKYDHNQTGWDIGYVSTPLKEYIDQLLDKEMAILIPGCGNSYEAEYLHENGFKNVYLVDISELPLKNFKKRCPDFPSSHLIHANFFDLEMQFDLILEQTFFCAIDPSLRNAYALKMKQLLKSGGRLVGVLFNTALNNDHPPFGGSKEEYLGYFSKYFDTVVMQNCYNSIGPRKGKELFVLLKKLD